MKRKILNVVLSVVLVLSLTTAVLAQSDESSGRALVGKGDAKSYIVVMDLSPIAAYKGDVAGYPATQPGKNAKIDPNSANALQYQKLLVSRHDASLAAAGVDPSAKINEYTYALNGYSALLTESEAKAIKAQKDVALVLEDQMRYVQTDSSPEFLGLTVRGGAYDSGITGEGVVVGVIDTGIWPEHPSFADDGSYAPPPITLEDTPSNPACNFGNTAHNPNDAPFTCNNKLIGARQMLATYRALIGADPDEFDSARDDDGHGTHTASTAAGNAGVKATVLGIPRGTISGIAPRAYIIAYKGLGNLGGFTSDLAAAIDQAVADGVDVINYSVGGGASLTGGDDIAYLFAADAGVFVATSAGNSGPGPGTIGGPASVPWITAVGASTQRRFFEGTVKLGNGKKYTGASITSGVDWAPLADAASLGNEYCDPAVPFSSSVAGKIVVCRRGVTARVAKSLAVYNAGGVGMIMHENSDVGNLFSDSHWVPAVHVDQTPGLAIKAYIASASTPRAKIIAGDDCDRHDDNHDRHSRGDDRDRRDHHDDDCTSTWPYAPSMTDFSSRGPNPVAPDIIKPDVTAPGLQILAGGSPFPDPGTTPPGELFQAIAGTSMSSPHVAGVFALLKQAHPDWSPAMAKSALMTTAYQHVRDNDRVSRADPFDMGAGHIDPGGRWDKKGSLSNPGLVYDAGFLDYLGFLCDKGPEVFSNPAATCGTLASLGIPTVARNLNYPSIGVAEVPGAETVIRTVTSVASKKATFHAKVVAPPGYSVTVTPKKLELNPGESATFEVTITNETAPIGEWRFGSLTWKGSGYEVYSPIAVKGALFSAPAELSGSGASGTTSFDVKFGYTGSYTAAPHGLVPATVTASNVVQDPDQTFNPTDGFSDAHTFNLTDVAYFRVAIPPEGTEANADLDVYVYDPDGNLAASSTLGGTDELVNIPSPTNGNWTVYVHGWSTPGGDSDYNMWTWEVPLATGGGSLSVDSAPTAATLGTVGSVTASWSGLTSGSIGDWYLGAVSHTGDAGLMGLTLINVDNR